MNSRSVRILCCWLLGIAAASCLGARVAWGRPELSLRPTPRPVVIEKLDGSFHEGMLAAMQPPQRPDRLVKPFDVLLEPGPIAIPSAEIRRIIVQPQERMVFRTDKTVSALDLGDRLHRTPEPHGWYQPDTSTEGWEQATLVESPYYRWRYIPQACWVWTKRTGRAQREETVLFRHEFFLPTTASLVSARLDVSADDQIESLFINGWSVPIPADSLVGKVSQWDVTYLMRPGRNLVATRVTNLASKEQLNYAGLCYRIACGLLPTVQGKPQPTPPGVRLLFVNGDRLSGGLESISLQQWRVRARGALVEVDPEWIDLALMNYEELTMGGQKTALSVSKFLMAPVRAVVRARPVRSAIAATPRRGIAWNLEMEPTTGTRGIRTRSGHWIEGGIEGLANGEILVKQRWGELLGVLAGRVALVQPNYPMAQSDLLFHPGDFPVIVRVRLINNDVLTGALEALSPSAVTISPQVSRPVRFDLDSVLSIEFVMNWAAEYRDRIARAWPVGVPRLIGAIGEGDASVGPSRDRTVRAIHRTIANLGLEVRWVDAYQMITAGFFTPERFPLLINFDQNERYFHTIRNKADAFEAIRGYVSGGGSLAHFARGVPFSLGYIPERGRWRAVRAASDLNAHLMMDIVTPDRRSSKARPFQMPLNRGQRMVFALNRHSPLAEGLPAEVEFPMIGDARFRPINDERVTSPGLFVPVYYLMDDQGINYGVAMAAICYDSARPHYGVYVSHPLFEATVGETPMIEYLLPRVIELAVGKSEAPIGMNLVSPPGGNSSRTAEAVGEPQRTASEPTPPAPDKLP